MIPSEQNVIRIWSLDYSHGVSSLPVYGDKHLRFWDHSQQVSVNLVVRSTLTTYSFYLKFHVGDFFYQSRTCRWTLNSRIIYWVFHLLTQVYYKRPFPFYYSKKHHSRFSSAHPIIYVLYITYCFNHDLHHLSFNSGT